MATAFLQPKNDAYSTIATVGGIDGDDLSLDVAAGEGARFPQPGNSFHIKIDDEILVVTGRSTDTFTVTRGAEGTTPAAHAQGASVVLTITAQAVSDLNTAVNAIENAKGAASGYASLDGSTKVVQQPASISDHINNTDGGAAFPGKACSANVMYNHAQAMLSATVHPNTSFFYGYLSTDKSDIPSATIVRVAMDTEVVDAGNNHALPTSYWFNGTQADADSDATHIEDDDGAFTTATGKANGLRYCRVVWSSDAGYTTNKGEGYVTTVDADTLTIVKSSGADFAANYYYWITKGEYTVPAAGYYLLIGTVQFTSGSVVADKRYQAAILVNGSAVARQSNNCSVTGYPLSVTTILIQSCAAGDLIALGAMHDDGAGTSDIDGDSLASTRLQIYRILAT